MNDAEKLYAALDETYAPEAPAPAAMADAAAPAAVVLEEPFPLAPESTGTSAADPGALTLEGAKQLRAQFEANPEAVLAYARRGFDESLTVEQLRVYLDNTVAALEAPAVAAAMVTADRAFAEAAAQLPPDFDFDGYDPNDIEVDYGNSQFESQADWLGWVVYSGPTWLREGASPKRYPFRSHAAEQGSFHYAIPDAGEVALFSDFGTHLYHSRYIAKHIAARRPPTAVHLGDVYYAGKQSEFNLRFINDLQPLLEHTELFTLAGNHEMYSAGIPFVGYMDARRGANQRQQGGYFSLHNNVMQIIGIDTQYYGGGRYRNADLHAWLRERLAAGRQANLTNIVVSSDNPYTYGNRKTTDLFDDVRGLAGGIDLWFWGNTHYCALFTPGTNIPFIGSCIGHGGYPYDVKRAGRPTPEGVRVPFLETRSRFHKWPALKPDRGNNGFCMLRASAAEVELRYVDWMNNLRCTAVLDRAADGRLTIDTVTEHHT